MSIYKLIKNSLLREKEFKKKEDGKKIREVENKTRADENIVRTRTRSVR